MNNKMVKRVVIFVITEMVTAFIVFVLKKYKENPNFLKDIQDGWKLKKEEFMQRFSLSVSETKQKVDDVERELKDSLSEKKEVVENVINEIREFFDSVIDEHFNSEDRVKVKKDFKKKLTNDFGPIIKKTTFKVAKELFSALPFVIKEKVKKKKK